MSVLLDAHACGFRLYSQERRKEFEANLEKAGLQLETEDKSVRKSTTEHSRHLVDSLLRRTIA